MIKLSELLSPIAQAIKNELWTEEYLHVDNSPGIVGRGAKKSGKSFDQGYFWPLFNPNIGVYFEFSRDKSYRSFETIISGYKGTLISDAEEIFEKYVTAHELSWQLCWMHIRRNFFDAERNNAALAGEALQYIRALYRVEHEIKEKKFTDPEKVSKQRVESSLPILEQFRAWLRKTSATPEAITDELLSKAINYVLSRWEAAILYISGGSLPIDNGADEREVRPLKLGFKNYLFCASEVGARAAAIFYTLLHSAKMHRIHPYYYLLDLCKRITEPNLTAADLVPHIWKARFFEQAVPEHCHFVITK
jgi:transposase